MHFTNNKSSSVCFPFLLTDFNGKILVCFPNKKCFQNLIRANKYACFAN